MKDEKEQEALNAQNELQAEREAKSSITRKYNMALAEERRLRMAAERAGGCTEEYGCDSRDQVVNDVAITLA